MKTGIKRIEQTLHRLQHQPPVQSEGTTRSLAPIPDSSSLSFDIRNTRSKESTSHPLSNASTDSTQSLSHLQLPKPKTVAFTPHRNVANPALASTLLNEMLTLVEALQTEFAQITLQIQNLYLDGPIIDGWLESNAPSQSVETIAFRHADITQLINFVEQLQSGKIAPQQISLQGAAYRICGLNADGQLWHYPCPPEQVPAVSVAIARHHQLRQLRTRQQSLEERLAQFSENLVRLHSQLKD